MAITQPQEDTRINGLPRVLPKSLGRKNPKKRDERQALGGLCVKHKYIGGGMLENFITTLKEQQRSGRRVSRRSF